jgi:hypothetical protein
MLLAEPTEYDIGFSTETSRLYAPFNGVIVKVKLRVTLSGATADGPLLGNFINVTDSDADLTGTNAVGIAHDDALGTEYVWEGNGTEFDEGDHLKFDATSGTLTGAGTQHLSGWWILRRVFPDEITTW